MIFGRKTSSISVLSFWRLLALPPIGAIAPIGGNATILMDRRAGFSKLFDFSGNRSKNRAKRGPMRPTYNSRKPKNSSQILVPRLTEEFIDDVDRFVDDPRKFGLNLSLGVCQADTESNSSSRPNE
jgi:hypothetical protein